MERPGPRRRCSREPNDGADLQLTRERTDLTRPAPRARLPELDTGIRERPQVLTDAKHVGEERGDVANGREREPHGAAIAAQETARSSTGMIRCTSAKPAVILSLTCQRPAVGRKLTSVWTGEQST